MKYGFVLLFCFTLTFVCCKSKKSINKQQQIRHTANIDSIANIEANELNHPANFLNVEYQYKKDSIGKWIIKGTIFCESTMAYYRDAVLNISYCKKPKAILGTSQVTIEKNFSPHTKTIFEFNTSFFSSADSINIKVMTARIED